MAHFLRTAQRLYHHQPDNKIVRYTIIGPVHHQCAVVANRLVTVLCENGSKKLDKKVIQFELRMEVVENDDMWDNSNGLRTIMKQTNTNIRLSRLVNDFLSLTVSGWAGACSLACVEILRGMAPRKTLLVLADKST